MATSAKYVVPFRRKREGKTDYRKRLKLLKSGKKRLVVRKTNRYVIAQIVDYDPKGDKVLVNMISKILQKYSWNWSFKSLPASYLVGLLIGKKAKELGINELILDMGMHTASKGNRIFALVKGVVDAGVQVPVDAEMFPDDDRLSGKHIDEKVAKDFEKLKEKIINE